MGLLGGDELDLVVEGLEGRQEGRLLEKREAVLKLLKLRFREVPDDLREGIQRTEAADVLEALFEQALMAQRIEDLRAALPDGQ